MNSSRETLLREEEEERKYLRYPFDRESNQEVSPPGQPIRPQRKHTPDIFLTNPPNDTISDDNASDFFLLQDLKPLVRSNLENRQDQTAQEPTNIKQEILPKRRIKHREGAKCLSYAD